MGEDIESKTGLEGNNRQAQAWYASHTNNENPAPRSAGDEALSWAEPDIAADDECQQSGNDWARPHQADPATDASLQAERPAFVRQRTPHRTQPAVNDLQLDDAYDKGYSHDTSYTLSHRPVVGSTYRRSRSGVSKAQKELRYGQYLSVPKGGHEIFGKRERIRRRQIAVAVIAVVAIVVVIAIFLAMPR